jgi:hypothetical protein
MQNSPIAYFGKEGASIIVLLQLSGHKSLA